VGEKGERDRPSSLSFIDPIFPRDREKKERKGTRGAVLQAHDFGPRQATEQKRREKGRKRRSRGVFLLLSVILFAHGPKREKGGKKKGARHAKLFETKPSRPYQPVRRQKRKEEGKRSSTATHLSLKREALSRRSPFPFSCERKGKNGDINRIATNGPLRTRLSFAKKGEERKKGGEIAPSLGDAPLCRML